MFLKLLVFFYFVFGATFLVCTTTIDDSVDIIRRQNNVPSFGVEMFHQPNFQGPGVTSTSASLNNSIRLGSSFQLLGGAWAAITSSSDNISIIVWDSVPDIAALSLPPGTLAITDIQSSGCSPPCARPGTCNPSSPVCICPKGFSGAQCQSCAEGHFGPTCLPCPSNCTSCDQGISGSGRCSAPTVSTVAKCNCVNGACESNGTACARCEQGFFLTSTGGCQTCQLGCASCQDHSGNCITCQSGFTQDTTDKTKCDPLPSKTSEGKVCPSGSFNDGTNSTGCSPCSGVCAACNGPSSNNCILCANLRAFFNDSCVTMNGDGICEGSGGMIADNNKHKCESCGAIMPNCMSCKIPNYNVASTINSAQCTGCLPGFFLSNGKCVNACPSGSFGSENACTECLSPCSSCAGAADHCLTCTQGNFGLSGKCVTTCPQGTFTTNGTCINCHPNCKTCNGTSFDQCTSCFPNLPVLQSGRCLATCNQTQFFDTTSSTCKDCDPSCSSCSGSGRTKCLACVNPSVFIVVNGTCSPTPQLVPP